MEILIKPNHVCYLKVCLNLIKFDFAKINALQFYINLKKILFTYS